MQMYLHRLFLLTSRKWITFVQNQFNELAMTNKKKNEIEQGRMTVQDAVSAYGSSQHDVIGNEDRIPEGYVSFERFGEIFHQTLDECYEKLHAHRQ